MKFLWTRYNAWVFLFKGPEMIQDAFDKVRYSPYFEVWNLQPQSQSRPFEMFAPDNRYVFVSSPEQIKEVDSAPDTILSLQAASKQVRLSKQVLFHM